MEISLLDAAADAFITLMDPFRLMMLSLGVFLGLFLGIVPGIGGLVGMALLLPFTFTMDSYAAFAMLLGMSAVVGTGDTIPAVLFGVPGSAGAQATIMDGNPMAKRGEAGRALSAAYMSSLLGGIVGAMLLAFAIPVLRPVMLNIGSPEMLGFAVFGIAMVAVLSGTSPLRGLVVAGVGVLISMIGTDPQTGILRFTMGTYYLWDGLPIVPLVLGLFALPELADMAISRTAIASESKYDTRSGVIRGLKDVAENWWLAVRGGVIGAGVGAIPGLGSTVVDWIAYGWASQTVKDGKKTFGKGDVRGVIAPESANNAITAGALVPTIAFGVPGSSSMAILLSVFLIHGIVPGPDMLSKNLAITYSMVWSIAMANILGAGLCFAFSGYLAKIALLRYTLILPPVLVFVYIGSFQSSRNWGDLYALLLFAMVGWTMKQLKWPRPPLILGFVLGELIERYMFISTSRYGLEWLSRPIVIILFGGAFLLLALPLYQAIRSYGGMKGISNHLGAPRFAARDLFYVFVLALVGYTMLVAWNWPWAARIGPISVGAATLSFCGISLLNQVFSRRIQEERILAGEVREEVHMDSIADHGDLDRATIFQRAAIFLAYLVGFIVLMATAGIVPTVLIFVIGYMWLERRENWKLLLGMGVGTTAFVYITFDQLMRIPWPPTLLGTWFPILKVIPTV